MSTVSQVNGNINIAAQADALAQVVSDQKKLQKVYEGLLAEMEAIVAKVQKIIAELTELAESKTPPSPEQLAQILGQLHNAMDEMSQLRQKGEALLTSIEYAGLKDATQSLKATDPQFAKKVQQLLNQEVELKTMQSQLSALEKKTDAVLKAVAKIAEAIAKMAADHGSTQSAQSQQLIQEIDQLEDLLSKIKPPAGQG